MWQNENTHIFTNSAEKQNLINFLSNYPRTQGTFQINMLNIIMCDMHHAPKQTSMQNFKHKILVN